MRSKKRARIIRNKDKFIGVSAPYDDTLRHVLLESGKFLWNGLDKYFYVDDRYFVTGEKHLGVEGVIREREKLQSELIEIVSKYFDFGE
jgi:hypothetical protein